MKFVNIIKLLMLGIFINSTALIAQEGIDKKDLTKVQLNLLNEQRTLIKTNRETFKASLSTEQLAILKNATLSKQEKRDALILTFTETQKKLLEENKVKVIRLKEQFRATLTLEQRQRIRTRLRLRSGNVRNKIRESIKENRQKRRQRNSG